MIKLCGLYQLVQKYQKNYDKKIEKQIKLGKNPSVDTIVFGNVSNVYSAFLIQNMFPDIDKILAILLNENKERSVEKNLKKSLNVE